MRRDNLKRHIQLVHASSTKQTRVKSAVKAPHTIDLKRQIQSPCQNSPNVDSKLKNCKHTAQIDQKEADSLSDFSDESADAQELPAQNDQQMLPPNAPANL